MPFLQRSTSRADSAKGIGIAAMPRRQLGVFCYYAKSVRCWQLTLWRTAVASLVLAFGFNGQVSAKSLFGNLDKSTCALFDLYVWAGPDDWTVGANDQLLVYTVSPCSQKSPSLKWRVDIGTVGNEPHHMAFNKDRSFLLAGGLLSFASGLPSLYFFRTNGKDKPVLIRADTPINCTAADIGVPTKDGGMLIPCMGGPGGRIGGQLLVYNRKAVLSTQFPPKAEDIIKKPPYMGFNPHGLAMSSDGSFVPMGVMDITWINGYAIATCTATGKLYWVDPVHGEVGVAYDFLDLQSMPQLAIRMKNNSRLFVSVNGQSKVAKFDASNPKRLVLLAEAILPEGAGPHAMILSPDESTLIVSDYFLDEKNVNGVLRYPGDKQVRFFKVSTMKEIGFLRMDFKSIVNSTVAYRPHGMQVYPLD